MKKIILTLVTIATTLSFMMLSVYAQPWDEYDYSRFNSNTYVYDDSGTFDEETMAFYQEKLAGMKAKQGLTYVILIVSDYDGGGSLEEFMGVMREKAGYSRDYVALGIGLMHKDIAIDTHGRGIDILCDTFVKALFDRAVEHIKNDNYKLAVESFMVDAEAMTESFQNGDNFVKLADGTRIGRNASVKESNAHSREINFGSYVLWFFVSGLIISAVATIMEMRKHKSVGKATYDVYEVKGEAQMVKVEDIYIRSQES